MDAGSSEIWKIPFQSRKKLTKNSETAFEYLYRRLLVVQFRLELQVILN